MPSMADTSRAQEVYFDGGCPLCSREIAAYKRLGSMRDVEWTDLTDPSADVGEIDRSDALKVMHVRRADGRLATGAAAFTAIWRNDPRMRPLARLLDVPPFSWLAEAGYWIFLRIRPLWRR